MVVVTIGSLYLLDRDGVKEKGPLDVIPNPYEG